MNKNKVSSSTSPAPETHRSDPSETSERSDQSCHTRAQNRISSSVASSRLIHEDFLHVESHRGPLRC
ncbi:uncharacterized [Tachysurus ichikawai]